MNGRPSENESDAAAVVVVLDSTSLISDFLLRSAPFQSLAERGATGALSIVVPEVVVRETTARFGRDCEEVAVLDRRSASLRSRLGLAALGSASALDVDGAKTKYAIDLRSSLRSSGAQIVPIPAVPHEELVDRAVSRRKPFADSGNGYRDALIWQTVLDQARLCAVVLVTNNYKDFAESDDRVSVVCGDLASDLAERGLRHDAVLVARDVTAAIEHLFVRHERLLKDLHSVAPISSQDLLDAIGSGLFMSPVNLRGLGLPEDASHPYLMDLDCASEVVFRKTAAGDEEEEAEADPIRILDAQQVDEATAFLTIQTVVEALVSFSIPAGSLALREEAMKSFSLEGGEYQGFRHGTAWRKMVLHAGATYDLATKKLTAATPKSIDIATPRPTPSNAQLQGLSVGEAVDHGTFGRGLVLELSGTGATQEAVVRFERVGDKRLMLAYAPLQRPPQSGLR